MTEQMECISETLRLLVVLLVLKKVLNLMLFNLLFIGY